MAVSKTVDLGSTPGACANAFVAQLVEHRTEDAGVRGSTPLEGTTKTISKNQMAEFKKLVGKRVLLNKPVQPESKIQITPEVQAKMDHEMMEKWTALEVFAVGDEVELVKPGDRVFVETYALQSAGVVNFSKEENKTITHSLGHFSPYVETVNTPQNIKLMVAERDIAIVW